MSIMISEVIFLLRKKGEHRIIMITAVFFILFTLLSADYYALSVKQTYVRAAEKNSVLTLNVDESQGTIYDRNMTPMVNTQHKYMAAAVPSAIDVSGIAPYANDSRAFTEMCSKGRPFVFECKEGTPESDGLTVFDVPVRYTDDQSARHVIGFLSDGTGADGIEYAYDSILRNENGENSVSYITDGFGNVLIGDGKKVTRSNASEGGVVLTIDSSIQKICEECGKGIKKGAVIAVDVKSGDILAMASFPSFDMNDMEKELNDPDSPLINRCLYSYSVGSVFKLVTAAEAIEEGMGNMMYDCSGNIDIGGQLFNCHKADGHGLQDIGQAMTNSCNTYFIDLARCLDTAKLRQRANDIGFGRENWLCAGITGSAGTLPTVGELRVPAELANFSFGQGKLTATPLQITQLACAIANDGKMPMLRLIRGMTVDGDYVSGEKDVRVSEVMSSDTAQQLRKMMIKAVRDNKKSKARSKTVSVGAKTSTAQTGRFDEKGEELCNAWITGFFPSRKPRYAVTVLIEDGGYGNDAAAPIFRRIAEEIIKKKK